MASVFLVHTPYHLLLACSIALSKQDKENTLFVYRDFDFDTTYLEQPARLFSEVIILKGNLDHGRSNLFNKIIYQKDFFRNIRFIRGLFERKDVTSVYVFNDNRVENKKAMQFCAKSNSCRISYVEDGSAVYSSNSDSPRIKDIVKLGLIRFFYRLDNFSGHSSVLGSNTLIDERIVLFSELVRKELSTGPISEISSEKLIESINFLFGSSIDRMCSMENSVIVFLDLFDFAESFLGKYMILLERIVDHCESLGKKVYMKYHPRERNLYAKILLDKFEKVYFIDKEIPSEAVISKCHQRTAIISSVSTSLITASKISDSILRISLMNLLNIEDKGLKSAFLKLGVSIPGKFEDLERLLTDFFFYS